MALRQVTATYRPGYNYGIGAELASGSPMQKVVDGTPTPTLATTGAVVTFHVRRIHETSELEESLGVDAEASYGVGSFGPNISARVQYAHSSKVQTNSLFMLVSAHVELAFLSIDHPVLTAEAAVDIHNPGLFENRYGNMFVRGVSRGGLFAGILRINTRSSQQVTEMAAELEGSYGLFSASAETKFKQVQNNFKGELSVSMYHEGGPVGLQINDPGDPLELLRCVNEFITSFAQDPDNVAVPYYVTLAPIAIAAGAVPLNAAEIQHAQDVLAYCAARRSNLLDQLNLLDYILDKAPEYDMDVNSKNEIEEALGNIQHDLDLLNDCASVALNNRANAKFPEDYAKDKGDEFGKGRLPLNLPAPKAAAQVTKVPDFTNCQSWDQCAKLADSRGLAAAGIKQLPKNGLKRFEFLSVTPPAGADVAVGSTVTITYETLWRDHMVRPLDRRLLVPWVYQDYLATLKKP